MTRFNKVLIGVLLVAACDRKVAEEKPVTAAAATPVPVQPAQVQPAAAGELTPPIPSAAMVEQMLAQLVLDHPRVTPYLHTEVPANVPVRVAPSPDLAQGAPELRAGGQAVRVVPVGEARIIFKGRERIGAARERLRFEIPAEGVAGHVDVELADNVWRAVDASVTER